MSAPVVKLKRTLEPLMTSRRFISASDRRRAAALAKEAGIELAPELDAGGQSAILSKEERAKQREALAQLVSLARGQLYGQGAKAMHAELDLETFEPFIARALREVDARTLRWLRSLGMSSALRATLAAICDALYCPIRFVGGCDDVRGFDASGNEWARLAALVMGAPEYSSRWLSKTMERWENDGRGFRVQRLEHRAVVDKAGKEHEYRYIRNKVYLTADELLTWACCPELRKLRNAIRGCVPGWTWSVTDGARCWRLHGLTYRDTLTKSREDLKQISAARIKARAKFEYARRGYRSRPKRSENSTPNLQASSAAQTVPISRSSPKGRDITSLRDINETAQSAAIPSGQGDDVARPSSMPIRGPTAAPSSASHPSSAERRRGGVAGTGPLSWSRYLESDATSKPPRISNGVLTSDSQAPPRAPDDSSTEAQPWTKFLKRGSSEPHS
jgi:hypothetical protein